MLDVFVALVFDKKLMRSLLAHNGTEGLMEAEKGKSTKNMNRGKRSILNTVLNDE